jgi:hypothetical protein
VQEIVWESGGGGSGGVVSWPTLMKTNYTEWTILMRVQLQGVGLRDVVGALGH